MAERLYTGFYASFLGGFSLSYEGKRINLTKGLRQKKMQILLILLKAGRQGIHRDRLAAMAASEIEGREKQLNNLRFHVFSLRKLIQGTEGFPAGEYIPVRKGIYYFSREYQWSSDIEKIRFLYRKIRDETDPEEKLNLRLEICRLYTGEFLPALSGEEWAVVESARYQQIYFSCLNQLCSTLNECHEYSLLSELCAQASRLYPYDGWQSVQIDCLLAQNRYQEAMKIYKDASEMLSEELGISLTFQNMESYHSKRGHILNTSKALSEIKRKLIEKEERRGAYLCGYPSFVDIYRIMARLGERNGTQSSLILCTLKDMQGRIPSDEEYTKEQMEGFRKLTSGLIRRSDVCACYSPNQLLLLLPDTAPEKGIAVIQRLQAIWKLKKETEKLQVEFMLQRVN